MDEIRAMLPAPTNSYRLDLREGVVTALQGFTGSQWKVITEVVGLLNVDAPTITLGDELLLQDELLEGDSESEDHARSVVEEASRAEGARGDCSGVLSGILGVIADSHLSFPAKQLSSTLVLEHDAVGAGGMPMVVDLGMAGILRFLMGVFSRQEVADHYTELMSLSDEDFAMVVCADPVCTAAKEWDIARFGEVPWRAHAELSEDLAIATPHWYLSAGTYEKIIVLDMARGVTVDSIQVPPTLRTPEGEYMSFEDAGLVLNPLSDFY